MGIELFSALLRIKLEISPSKLILKSLDKDQYLLEPSHTIVKNTGIRASEGFICLNDGYTHEKRDVYLSYLAHHILYTLDHWEQEEGGGHMVLTFHDKDIMLELMEHHICRVISQVQDAEYKRTGKTPLTFRGKPTLTQKANEKYFALHMEIEGFGKMTFVSFNPPIPRFRMPVDPVELATIVSTFKENELKKDKVTHLYRLEQAFIQKGQSVSRFDNMISCSRLLSDVLEEDCILSTWISKVTLTSTSYADRTALRLALRINPKKSGIIEETLAAMCKREDITILPDGNVLDPVSTQLESFYICSKEDYQYIIDEQARLSESSRIAVGIRTPFPRFGFDIVQQTTEQVSEQIAQQIDRQLITNVHRIMGIDQGRGIDMTAFQPITSPISPEYSESPNEENIRQRFIAEWLD